MPTMPAQRVLFVKLSSLGDVVHHMPAVTDLARARPGTHIAWAVEEAYVDLVRLHPGRGARRFPVGLRSLRRRPPQPRALVAPGGDARLARGAPAGISSSTRRAC